MNIRRYILMSVTAVMLSVFSMWAFGGRERLTKSGRAVQVQERDELFGDVTSHVELQPGPVFGFYVGLDVVAITALIAAVVTLVTIRMTRRSVCSQASGAGEHSHEN
jgi:hypothetical protein